MPISGLVVILRDEPQPRARALAAIEREPLIEVGILESNRLAIVLDTVSSEEDKQLWDWLNSLPGVSVVEVAFVSFEEPGPQTNISRTQMATHRGTAVGIEDGAHDGR